MSPFPVSNSLFWECVKHRLSCFARIGDRREVDLDSKKLEGPRRQIPKGICFTEAADLILAEASDDE
jgi:hypothetical protein